MSSLIISTSFARHCMSMSNNMQAIQVRCIYTSGNMKASKMQLGRIVNKVMNSDRTKKNQCKNTSQSQMISKSIDNTVKISSTTHTQQNRRVKVLNKIFMKYITDLMATGEIASKLLGKGIEVTHVKVAPDYKLVNVFWYSSDEESANESTERILKTSAGLLQHELSQLRVIGVVPPIQFVKNKQFGIMKEVENRLAKVDFGEDFVPSAYIIKDNNISVLETSLSDKVKEQLFNLNNSNLEKNNICEINIPDMKQDVMGFDHNSIMKKIKQSLHNIKNTEKNKLSMRSNEVASQATGFEVDSFLSQKQEKQVFEDFIKKRSLEEKKKKKSISLLQAKLEDESEWNNQMTNEYLNEDISIDEEYKDDYYEIEKYK